MYKLATLFILAFLLLSLVAHGASARPLQGAIPNTSLVQETGFDKGLPGEEAVVVAEDGCDGVSEDECLMRRSLTAHLDYIYTQKNKNP
uniref:Phytosulfokine n=1 Tax=Kalanchoe fedtschenkoi TaxID=63787 RepID=A0A7N0UPV4_KALFE